MSTQELSRINKRDALNMARLLLDGQPMFGGTVVMDLDDVEQDEQEFYIQGFVEYDDGDTGYPFTFTYHGVA